jgi:flavodoxin
MTNTLVVYYSLTGNTKEVAEIIAVEMDAFLEPIIDSVKRKGFFGYMRSGYEGMRRKRSVIKKPEKHPDQFDLVIVGSPTWVGGMASPVRSYLANHPLKSAKLATFCTSGGPQNAKVLADMAALSGQTPVATLGLSQSDIESGAHKNKIDAFITAVKAGSAELAD